jgi:UDP:flavonoid glycosyltransferase YjiC (YdhE family)
MLQAWITAIRMFGPEVMVLDFSPTASLAAILLKIPRVLIGAGFELPPVQNPLPPLPGYAWATPSRAREAEEQVLKNVNGVLTAMGASPLPALCLLVDAEHRFLATFPELDHYGVQAGGHYIGRLAESGQKIPVEWPEGHKRIFVYLRPGVPDLAVILQGIAATNASAIAYLPGVAGELIATLSSPRFVISPQPVSLDAVFESADLCVSYAAAGTLTEGLLHGVPQLMIPIHTESQLIAHRVEMLGVGRLLKASSVKHVTECVNHLLSSVDARLRAQQFAHRYKSYTDTAAVDTVMAAIESAAHQEPRQIARATQPPVRAAAMPAPSLLQ